jgi:hypothetical protein
MTRQVKQSSVIDSNSKNTCTPFNDGVQDKDITVQKTTTVLDYTVLYSK